MKVEVNTCLCGIPCIVRGRVLPPEPDVGVFSHYVEDIEVLDRRGKHAPWLERKMDAHDWEQAEEALLHAHN